MKEQALLDFLNLTEKLKNKTRHSWTSEGRRESVAEHVYGTLMIAWLLREEFPDVNMERVMELCLFHDLGEAITGDIPTFEKKKDDEETEIKVQKEIAARLPELQRKQLQDLFDELNEKKTKESQLFQAIDKMEAVIQHNQADIKTWLPLEYELQLTYGKKQVEQIPYMKSLKEHIDKITEEKIRKEGKNGE